jgi:hypothetical protein
VLKRLKGILRIKINVTVHYYKEKQSINTETSFGQSIVQGFLFFAGDLGPNPHKK